MLFFRLRLLLASTVLAFIAILPLAAQQADESEAELVKYIKAQPQNGFFGIDFSFTRPQGDFRRALDEVGKTGPVLGFALEGGYHFDPTPVAAGLSVDILFNGSEEKYFNYTGGHGRIYRDTVSASNTMVPIIAFFRFQPDVARVFEPYAEALAGITILTASSDFRTNFGSNSTNTEVSAAWNYGFGAGVNVRLVDFIELPNVNRSLSLAMNARYIIGGTVNYMVANYDDVQERVVMTDIRSKTDMFYFRAGVVWRF